MIEIAQGARIYLDSNVIIYWIEGADAVSERVRGFLHSLSGRNCRFMTSELTLAECLVRPAREGDVGLVELYERLLGDTQMLSLLPLDGALFWQSARRAGDLGLKLLDAVHYLSAESARCSALLTADRRFRSGPALAVYHV